jgi:hypothetical protein
MRFPTWTTTFKNTCHSDSFDEPFTILVDLSLSDLFREKIDILQTLLLDSHPKFKNGWMSELLDILNNDNSDPPVAFMMMRLTRDGSKRDTAVQELFSKPIHTTKMSNSILREYGMMRARAHRSDGSDDYSISPSSKEEGYEPKKPIKWPDFYESCDAPELNSHQTVQYFVEKGYIPDHVAKDKTPLEALIAKEHLPPKLTRLSDLDWSFCPEYGAYQQAVKELIARERNAGNSKAKPPSEGGEMC